jgi:hypothetical protein
MLLETFNLNTAVMVHYYALAISRYAHCGYGVILVISAVTLLSWDEMGVQYD